MISLPSYQVGASALLAWIETGVPRTNVRHAEKQIVIKAETPAYSLFVPNNLSPSATGMLCVAVPHARGGGIVV